MSVKLSAENQLGVANSGSSTNADEGLIDCVNVDRVIDPGPGRTNKYGTMKAFCYRIK